MPLPLFVVVLSAIIGYSNHGQLYNESSDTCLASAVQCSGAQAQRQGAISIFNFDCHGILTVIERK